MIKDELTEIPGIGPSLARDLHLLGYNKVTELIGAKPQAMYEKLEKITGGHQDRCVLYTFRCAVFYAEGGREPEKLKWWNWKD